MGKEEMGSNPISSPPNIVLSTRDLNKDFGSLKVLKGINCAIQEKEVVAIIGPSGSGKSTLLRCFNGLERATSGDVEVLGEELSQNKRVLAKQRENIGMVFQRFNLFPHLTALENIMEAPIRVKKVKILEARERAMVLLSKVNLSDKGDAYPSQLSGGQQQRIAIARSLAMNPTILLLDEPTSALDPELVGEVLQVIQQLAKEGMTMVMVTHEMAFARKVAERIIFMADGEIVEEGIPGNIFENASSTRTRQFLQQVTHTI